MRKQRAKFGVYGNVQVRGETFKTGNIIVCDYLFSEFNLIFDSVYTA